MIVSEIIQEKQLVTPERQQRTHVVVLGRMGRTAGERDYQRITTLLGEEEVFHPGAVSRILPLIKQGGQLRVIVVDATSDSIYIHTNVKVSSLHSILVTVPR